MRGCQRVESVLCLQEAAAGPGSSRSQLKINPDLGGGLLAEPIQKRRGPKAPVPLGVIAFEHKAKLHSAQVEIESVGSQAGTECG